MTISPNVTKLVAMGIDSQVASTLIAGGITTPAEIKATTDPTLEAKPFELSPSEIAALRVRFPALLE